MTNNESLKSRRRLSDIKSSRDLLPFLRASTIEDVSLYWLGVPRFPIDSRRKQWILAFLENLKDELKKEKQVVETFLQLKYTRTDLNERFTNTLFEYRPMTGVLIGPGEQLPQELTSLEAKRLTESHAADGTINLDHLVPDYCAWFAGSQDTNQRNDFFGAGGMLMIWIDESLGMPIRSESKSEGRQSIMNLTNISLTVDGSLFQIPEGYKKVATTEITQRLAKQ